MSYLNQEQVYRFSLPQRFIHFVVMVGFLMLSITGLALAFGSLDFFRFLMWIMGGQNVAAFLHRFFAFLVLFCVFLHAFWFIYYRYVLKRSLFDYQTIMFKIFDLKHLGQNFLYFIGKRSSAPEFYKYTYMQKLYYWAVFLGMIAMTITGIIHMYPEYLSAYLAGFIFNIAEIIHFWEAILAIIVKVLFHAVSEHLRPIIFPMDKSIFNGKMPRDVMKKEHAGELKMLQAHSAKSATE